MASFRPSLRQYVRKTKSQKLDPDVPNLVSVLLHQGPEFASSMLQDMATHLSLERMGNIMTALLSAAKNTSEWRAELAKIVLWKAPKVWDNAVKVRQVFRAMTSTPLWKKWIDTSEVKELTLGYRIADNIVVTDEWLHLVGSGKFPRLISLNLELCRNITDAGVSLLADKCSQLTSLNLRSCRITDASVIQLADKCSQLTSLNLTWCSNITDTSVIQLAHKCSQLTSLNLTDCDITDASVIQLALCATQLTSLDLSGCWKITNASVIQLAQKCSKLTFLNVEDTHITYTCCRDLRQTYPQLDINK